MASGCFPIYTTDSSAKPLLDIRQQLRNYIDEWSEEVYTGQSGGLQYDNTASDGGYLERLRVAIEMIDGCLYEPKEKTQKTI